MCSYNYAIKYMYKNINVQFECLRLRNATNELNYVNQKASDFVELCSNSSLFFVFFSLPFVPYTSMNSWHVVGFFRETFQYEHFKSRPR